MRARALRLRGNCSGYRTDIFRDTLAHDRETGHEPDGKIIYLADFTEPTRDFEGVEPLRKLCFEDNDRAMELGLRMSL